jgi:hypothetical protein
LTLLNETTFVEAARALAQRMILEGGSTAEERITFAFRLATSRSPKSAELEILQQGLRKHLDHYRQATMAAQELLKVGAMAHNVRLEPCELAAYTATASVILNLDETITKP